MEKRKIVTYESISSRFKKRVALKYALDKTLTDVKTDKDSLKAIDSWYRGVHYAVIVDDLILGIIEWDSCQKDDFEEDVDLGGMFQNELPDDTDNFFYS